MHSTLDGTEAADFTFAVKFNAREHSVAVRQRPFLAEFLQRVAQLFEVVVFTASQKVYAEQVLNVLDPRRSVCLLKHILLCSNACCLHVQSWIDRILPFVPIISSNMSLSFMVQMVMSLCVSPLHPNWQHTPCAALGPSLAFLHPPHWTPTQDIFPLPMWSSTLAALATGR